MNPAQQFNGPQAQGFKYIQVSLGWVLRSCNNAVLGGDSHKGNDE
jgi:hypothetical protein